MIGNNRVITAINMQQAIGIIQAIVIGLHRRPGFTIAQKWFAEMRFSAQLFSRTNIPG
jgi:hypothetical protein